MNTRQNIFLDAFELPYAFSSPGYLCNKLYSNVNFVQRLALERKLGVHSGCVNTICWNDGGQYILSGSDDQKLVVTNPFSGKVNVSIQSGHRANIFSAKFMPNTRDKQVISCSGDGLIYYTHLDRTDQLNGFDCHFGTTYEVLTVPQDPHSFLSCGEDGTVRWYDLRIKDKCTKEECKEDVLINCRRAVTAIAINPVMPYQLAVGCSDSTVRIFDRRMLGTKATGNYTSRGIMGMVSRFSAPGLENRYHRITSLSYSHDGEEILASYSSEHIYLFNLKENGKLAKEFGTESSSKDSGARPKTSGKQPPIKRLRLRGDWSDTGPSARPEGERGEDGNDQAAATIMQRMSDMLTRWLEGTSRREDDDPDQQSPEPSTTSNAETEEADPMEPGRGQDEGESAKGRTHEAMTEKAEDSRVSDSETSDIILGGPLPCIGTSARRDSRENSKKLLKPVPKTETKEIKAGQESAEVVGLRHISSLTDCDINPKLKMQVVEGGPDCSLQTNRESQTDISKHVGQRAEPQHQALPISSHTEGAIVDDTLRLQEGASHSRKAEDENKTALESSREHPVEQSSDFQQEIQQNIVTNSTSQSMESLQPTEDPVVLMHEHLQNLEDIPAVPLAVSKALSASSMEPLVSLKYTSVGTCASTIRIDCGHRPISDGPSNLSSEASQVEQSADTEVVSATVPEDLRGCPDVAETGDLAASLAQAETVSGGGRLELHAGTVGTMSSTTLPDAQESENDGISQCSELKPCDLVSDSLEVNSTRGGTESEMDESISEMVDSVSMVSITSTDSNDIRCEKADLEAGTIDKAECLSTDATSDKETEPSEGPKETNERDDDASPSTSGVRQRKIGVSGPPSGSHASVYDSEEDDSDTERMRAARRSRRGRWGPRTSPSRSHREDEATKRNAAARKLQELYRKRQEDREREELEQMQLPQPTMKREFSGHRNARTMIKEACFWGRDFVMSGSDCGHVFIWDRYTTELVMLLEGDKHVVNCVQPHPFDPVLATSGIDYDIKLWTPTAKEPCFDQVRAKEILTRNEVMLEETKDTITVPASFMLRMLASLNHFRNVRRGRGPDGESSPSSEENDD